MTSPQWRTSSYTGPNGNCVEVATAGGARLVRDTKQRQAGHLRISDRDWRSFLDTITSGAHEH
jgi:Domain of unknown function (DUF397)